MKGEELNRTSIYKLTQLTSLFFVIFIETFCWFIIAPVLLHLYMKGPASILPATSTLAVRDFLYGVTMALSPLAFVLFSPFVGISSDKFGRKKILLFCLVATILGFILPIYGITKRVVIFILLGRFIGGISTTSQSVVQAAVTDFAQDRRTKSIYFSIIAFAMSLGLLLGPLVGAYFSDSKIVSWFNVRVPFYIGGTLAFINLLLLIFCYHPKKRTKRNVINLEDFKFLFKHLCGKTVLLLFASFFLLEFSWSQYYQAIFLFLSQHFNYSAEYISDLTAYASVFMCIALSVIFPITIRYISIKRFLLISMVGMSIGMFGCVFSRPVWQWVFIIPVAIFTATAYVLLLTMLSGSIDKKYQGWMMGVAGTVLALAWLITGFLSGVLTNIAPALPLEFALAAIIIGTLVVIRGASKNGFLTNVNKD